VNVKNNSNGYRPNLLTNLKNRYQGQRCFIMGNGPSLNQTNLELLETEYVWGVNRCYLLFERIRWRPSFYVTNDQRLTQYIANELVQMVKESPTCLYFFPSNFRDQKILSNDLNAYWYNNKILESDQVCSDWVFSTDPSKWVAASAAYLGFSPIYMIGCDTSYVVPNTVMVEDSDDHLISSQDDDPNHFAPEYLGAGVKWTAPDTDMMICQYKKSKLLLDKLGVDVYNATVGGSLEVFQRIHLEDVFNG
jgi:hypothetical protein